MADGQDFNESLLLSDTVQSSASNSINSFQLNRALILESPRFVIRQNFELQEYRDFNAAIKASQETKRKEYLQTTNEQENEVILNFNSFEKPKVKPSNHKYLLDEILKPNQHPDTQAVCDERKMRSEFLRDVMLSLLVKDEQAASQSN